MYSQGIVLVSAALSLAALSNWTAVLEPKSGSTLEGSASVASINLDSIRATVQVTAAVPGTTYKWHVHRGTCNALGEIYGKGESYPTITAGKDGVAGATVGLAAPPPVKGDYSVNVHSAIDMTSVACGNLKPADVPDPPKGNAEAEPAPSGTEPPKPPPAPDR